MAEAGAMTGDEAWEAEGQGRGARSPSLPSSGPRLSVAGYEGPLDFLLEMVRRQRVDLGPLSILALTDQLVAAIEAGEGRHPLERRAEWLVMASQLLLLKAQLLAPASPEEAEDARAAADRRLAMLDELARMRAGAAWLSARPQLGRETFGRGEGALVEAPRSRAEEVLAFLEATLVLLEGREARPGEAPPAYRPRPPDLWRLPDALRRIAEMLGQGPGELTLEQCLPAVPVAAPDRPIRLRAALASTFVAGLEMARDGAVTLAQEGDFEAIRFSASTGAKQIGPPKPSPPVL